jgi:hypothetical protein
MLKRSLVLLAAALACIAAAPAPKPPAKAPAVKTAPKAVAAPVTKLVASGPFDIRSPASLVSLLTAAGATAKIDKTEDDGVLVGVTSVAANFSIQFAGCERSGRNCKAMLLDAPTDGAPTLAQLNAFNQTSATCRSYQDRSGKAHILYSALLFADDNREHAATELAGWQGCIAEFHTFLQDPNAYLAEAP